MPRTAYTLSFRDSDIERFWSYVPDRPETGCWLWRGGGTGYGAFWLDGKTIGAHIVSFVLAGGTLEVGKVVCHTCDVVKCVRPLHLFQGTTSENALDAVAKQRWAPQHGWFNPVAKLSQEQVEALRIDYGPHSENGKGRRHGQVTMAQLATKYGLSVGQVCAAIRGKTYNKR